MISFKASQLDLIALKRNNVKMSNNTIMIVLIAKGMQGLCQSFAIAKEAQRKASLSLEGGLYNFLGSLC